MRAILSVVGHDKPGILAFVATKCAENNVNIVDVSQTVIQDMFTMIMIVNIEAEIYASFVELMETEGKNQGLSIHVMNEDSFNAMHTI